MKQHLGILVAAAILCGCDNSEELVFHESETVSAVRSRSERFTQLFLGSPARPYTGVPPVTLRVPDIGEIQITAELEGRLSQLIESSERLDASERVTFGVHPGRGPRSGKKRWGAGAWTATLDVKSGSIELVAKDEAILGVAIYKGAATEARPIEVKTEDSDWHALPLSREALADLFGESKGSYRWMAE